MLFTILSNVFLIVLSERFILEFGTSLKFVASEEVESIFLIMKII